VVAGRRGCTANQARRRAACTMLYLPSVSRPRTYGRAPGRRWRVPFLAGSGAARRLPAPDSSSPLCRAQQGDTQREGQEAQGDGHDRGPAKGASPRLVEKHSAVTFVRFTRVTFTGSPCRAIGPLAFNSAPKAAFTSATTSRPDW